MAQAAQRNIIDLTGEEDDDNSIAKAHAACEKAFVAASRLTDHFESLKPSKSVPYKSHKEHVVPYEEDPHPAIAPTNPVLPRLGTFPSPARFDTNGLKKDVNDHAIIRQDASVSSPCLSLPQSALGIATSRPTTSPSILERGEGIKRLPGTTTAITSATDTSSIRTPRSAAVSAKQNIAETYNELEEWVNKDPNLIPQQTVVSTTRKQGRPRKDADEWSPSPSTKSNVVERKGLGRVITYSPSPSISKHEDLTISEGRGLFLIKRVSSSPGIKKRKYSGSPQPGESAVKLARWDGTSNEHHDYTPPDSAKSTSKKHVHDGCFPKCVYPALKAAKAAYKQSLTEDELTDIGKSITDDIVEKGMEAFCPASVNCPKNQRTELILKLVSETFHERALRYRDINFPFFKRDHKASWLECDLSNKHAVKMNESPSKPSTVKSGTNGVSTDQTDTGPFGRSKQPMLYTEEKIDPRLQQGFHQNSDPTKYASKLSSASTENAAFAAVFESVVYPAMRKSKKRHKTSLPWEELDAIGETIVSDVLTKLVSHPENPHQLDEDTKERIKQYVKKSFRQKVKKAKVLFSHGSATSMTILSSNNSGLQGTTEGESALPGSNRPSTTFPNTHQNGNKEAQALRQPRPIPLDPQLSLPSQIPPNESPDSPDSPDSPESPESPFGPNFDRGRYPALRRRRGNKYYTPARTPNTKLSHSIPSDDHLHSQPVTGLSDSNQLRNKLGASTSKDQVRLLKPLANQPTISRTNETRVLTTAAENKRTPTNQESALGLLASIEEPTDMGPVPRDHTSYGDVSKAQRETPIEDRRRLTDEEVTPAVTRGFVFPHLARSRISTATNQSAQQVLKTRLLEDSGPPKDPQPILRPKPATALDPCFEHVVAVLVTDPSSRPSKEEHRYSITSANQKQLVADRSIVTHVDLAHKVAMPKFVRVETNVIDPVRRPVRCISSLLRNRELGLSSRGRQVGTVSELRQVKSEMIEPWKHWKGASGDVVTVAWSPDSNVYAFGAAAHTNVEDIQYNRPCNLLLGNLTSNQIRELPDHRVDRPKPETIPIGPNATQAVYDACDPKVYETVTSVAFLPTGDRMLTASHDCTVKIWDISAGKHQCLKTLDHEAWVTSVEISQHQPGLFATASKCVKDAVRIYYDPSCHVDYSASRAEARPDWKIYPECLRWGPSPYNCHLLLAGFQQWEQQGDLLSVGGQLCLWDAHAFESIKVTPSSQSIYAAAWHPTEPFFATGGAPGNQIADKLNTKTVVRAWDVRRPKRCQVEYECPAIDMQDITFSPLNANVVTAGCTNGISYMWDQRWPDQPLHHLKHGEPLGNLDHTREREEVDTGVMMSLWGPSGSLFYTGSSDGMIKAWDVRRHPNDVLISNVANFNVSIQSGAFSPDGNNLLVGDAEGCIHVLSSAPCGPRSNVKSTDAYIDLVRASDGSGLKLDQDDDNPGTEGIEAAKSLVASGQLEYHSELGVGKGPNYQGPYATYARKEAVEPDIGRLRKKFEKKQPISKRGEKRWDIAIPMTSLLCERREALNREQESHKLVLDCLNEDETQAVQQSESGKPLRGPFLSTTEEALAVDHRSSTSLVDSLANRSSGGNVANDDDGESVEYSPISESEMVEENFWWDKLGAKEIDQAKAGRVRG